MERHSWNLEVFLSQLRTVKAMPERQFQDVFRSCESILNTTLYEFKRESTQVEAVISSMTPEERRDPAIIGNSRIQRIASGSGTCELDVRRLLTDFWETRRRLGGDRA